MGESHIRPMYINTTSTIDIKQRSLRENVLLMPHTTLVVRCVITFLLFFFTVVLVWCFYFVCFYACAFMTVRVALA